VTRFFKAFNARWVAQIAVLAVVMVTGLSVPAFAQEGPAPTLVEALKRERKLLKAERDALRARRSEASRASQKRLTELRQEVERERKRYESAWAAVLEAERELRELDTRLETMPIERETSGSELIRLERELGLESSNISSDGDGDEADDGEAADERRISSVFEKAAERIIDSSRVRRAPGAFFLPDGTRVQGEVVRIGAVAAAGVTPSGKGGVLVPVRDRAEEFQVLEPAGERVAEYLAGESGRLPALVYDPRNPPDPADFAAQGKVKEDTPERTWRDTVSDAAPVGYVIIALGLLALLVFLIRLAGLGRLTLREREAGSRLLEIMHEHHDDREISDLQAYARENDNALSRVTLQALSHRTLPLELYENSIQASLIMEIGRVGRGLSALRAIAAVSPLLGLLGTVIGMIATFEVLTVAGSASDPQALSGGIAQALATTQLGLVVAVPTLLGYSVLRGWAGRMETYIEHIAVEISTHIRELSLAGDAHHHGHGHSHGHELADARDDREEAS
jgi:biopolymer transport protein ExbB